MMSTRRTILITGASRGIGRAAAFHFAAVEQAEVHLCGRDASALADSAVGVRERRGVGHVHLGDVTDRAQLAEIASSIPHLDVVFANAGLGGMTPLDEDSDLRFDQIIAADLTGVWNTVRAFAPKMGRGGRIVINSSVLGRFGVAGYAAYCAAKHGVIGMTKALALELIPRGIQVNAIAPGWVDTDMARQGLQQIARAQAISVEESRRQAEGQVPVRRFFSAEEVAHGVAWLASPHNNMQVGQCLNLDGGAVQY